MQYVIRDEATLRISILEILRYRIKGVEELLETLIQSENPRQVLKKAGINGRVIEDIMERLDELIEKIKRREGN